MVCVGFSQKGDVKVWIVDFNVKYDVAMCEHSPSCEVVIWMIIS